MRNILGLIRALVVQSKPTARSLDDFADIIGGRIQALARAHDQITALDFTNVLLPDIIRTEFSAYTTNHASRCQLNGPDVLVEPIAFSTLALVFHELVTNSAKYGALSDSTGSVKIDWTYDEDGGCRIHWQESGGPPVQAPARRGFGSTIIERSIPHELGGEVRIDYLLGGVQVHLLLPSNCVRLMAAGEKGASDHSRAQRIEAEPAVALDLAGLVVLIVEDNMIIALDAEQIMIEHGAARVLTAASVGEARRTLQQNKIDVALLDVNLGPETSFPLAGDLNARSVPYVFVTGYGEQIDYPDEARGARAIKKPFAGDQLLSAIAEAAAKGASRSG